MFVVIPGDWHISDANVCAELGKMSPTGDVLRDTFFLGVMFVEPSAEELADETGDDAVDEDADDEDFLGIFAGDAACCSDWLSDPFFERF